MGRIEDGIAEMERAADAVDILPEGPERDKLLAKLLQRALKFGSWLQSCSGRDYEAARRRLGYYAWSTEELT